MRSITEFSKELLVVSISLLTITTGCGETVAPDEESVSQEELVRDTSIPHESQAVAHFSIPDAYVEDKALGLRSESRLDEASHQGRHRVHGPLPRVRRERPPLLRRPVQVIPLSRVRDHVSFKCADTASQIAAVMSVSLMRLSGEDAETIETARTHLHCQQLTIEMLESCLEGFNTSRQSLQEQQEIIQQMLRQQMLLNIFMCHFNIRRMGQKRPVLGRRLRCNE